MYPNEICDEYSKLSEGFEDYSYDQESVAPTCSIWVSFIEIYNEVIFDLLEPCSGSSRTQLKLCVDGHKNYFVKGTIFLLLIFCSPFLIMILMAGLKQICVQSAAEAYSIYLFGKKNLNVACTKMNENSSRSHCIFVIKLLNQSDPEFVTMSKYVFSIFKSSPTWKFFNNVFFQLIYLRFGRNRKANENAEYRSSIKRIRQYKFIVVYVKSMSKNTSVNIFMIRIQRRNLSNIFHGCIFIFQRKPNG